MPVPGEMQCPWCHATIRAGQSACCERSRDAMKELNIPIVDPFERLFPKKNQDESDEVRR